MPQEVRQAFVDFDPANHAPTDAKRQPRARGHYSPDGTAKDNRKKKRPGMLANDPIILKVKEAKSVTKKRPRSESRSKGGHAGVRAEKRQGSSRAVSRGQPRMDSSGQSAQASAVVPTTQPASRKRPQSQKRTVSTSDTADLAVDNQAAAKNDSGTINKKAKVHDTVVATCGQSQQDASIDSNHAAVQPRSSSRRQALPTADGAVSIPTRTPSRRPAQNVDASIAPNDDVATNAQPTARSSSRSQVVPHPGDEPNKGAAINPPRASSRRAPLPPVDAQANGQAAHAVFPAASPASRSRQNSQRVTAAVSSAAPTAPSHDGSVRMTSRGDKHNTANPDKQINFVRNPSPKRARSASPKSMRQIDVQGSKGRSPSADAVPRGRGRPVKDGQPSGETSTVDAAVEEPLTPVSRSIRSRTSKTSQPSAIPNVVLPVAAPSARSRSRSEANVDPEFSSPTRSRRRPHNDDQSRSADSDREAKLPDVPTNQEVTGSRSLTKAQQRKAARDYAKKKAEKEDKKNAVRRTLTQQLAQRIRKTSEKTKKAKKLTRKQLAKKKADLERRTRQINTRRNSTAPAQHDEPRKQRAAARVAIEAIMGQRGGRMVVDPEEEGANEETQKGRLTRSQTQQEAVPSGAVELPMHTEIQDESSQHRVLRPRTAAADSTQKDEMAVSTTTAIMTSSVQGEQRNTRTSTRRPAASRSPARRDVAQKEKDDDNEMKSPSRAGTPSTHRSPPRRSVRNDSKSRKRGDAQTKRESTIKISPSVIKKALKPSAPTITRNKRSCNAQQKNLPPTAHQQEVQNRNRKEVIKVCAEAESKRLAEAAKLKEERRKLLTEYVLADGLKTEEDVSEDLFNQMFGPVMFNRGPKWDRSKKQLEKLREEGIKEGFCADYAMELKDFDRHLRKIFQSRRMVYKANTARIWFWRFANLNNSYHLTHPNKDCANIWEEKKISGADWYAEEVKTVARFIHIKALCEKHTNPFNRPPSEVETMVCVCPKPKAPMWNMIVVEDSEVQPGQTKEAVMKEKWDKQFADLRPKIEQGMRNHLIAEIGNDQFERHFPKHKTPLEKRRDEFGKAVFKKAKELNKLRRAANQCPAFIFSWTKDDNGDINMPQEWIGDSGTLFSDGCKTILNRQKKLGRRPACKGDCSEPGHKCCNFKLASMKFNEDHLLVSKAGLFPLGVDGRDNPRTIVEHAYKVTQCDELCDCTDECPGKTVARGPRKMLILFRSFDRGWSIRTVETLVRGEYIFSFAGLVQTAKEINAKVGKKQDHNMFFDLTPSTASKKTKKMKKWQKILEKKTITTCIYANEFKYINHSCGPNAVICTVFSRKYGEEAHGVSAVARKTIFAFSEVTYDYFDEMGLFPFDCKCGTYACRG